jgi:hypothetical protein
MQISTIGLDIAKNVFQVHEPMSPIGPSATSGHVRVESEMRGITDIAKGQCFICEYAWEPDRGRFGKGGFAFAQPILQST